MVYSIESYTKFILALFTKKYSSRIKQAPGELFDTKANITEILDIVHKDLWIHTLYNQTIIPSKECLDLRALNLHFQLSIWTQATERNITVPDPRTCG